MVMSGKPKTPKDWAKVLSIVFVLGMILIIFMRK